MLAALTRGEFVDLSGAHAPRSVAFLAGLPAQFRKNVITVLFGAIDYAQTTQARKSGGRGHAGQSHRGSRPRCRDVRWDVAIRLLEAGPPCSAQARRDLA